MPRKPKPFPHQGWFYTSAGGKQVKLCPVGDGFDAAERALVALLAARGTSKPTAAGSPTAPATLADVYATFMRHAETYYRLPSGKPSQEVRAFRHSFAELLKLHGGIPAASLTREHVKAARQVMIDAGKARKLINQRVGRVKRAVRWLVEEHHLPDAVWASVSAMSSLKPFRSAAVELPPVPPVPAAHVAATLPHLVEPWASLVRLQWWAGIRPGEACGLKLEHLRGPVAWSLGSNGDGGAWSIDYGTDHKMAYKGQSRVVQLGPQAVLVLLPWIVRAVRTGRENVFQAKYAVRVRHGPRCPAGTAYANAVKRAAKAAGVPHWHPNQLRHSHGTRVRPLFGLDGAQKALGHKHADVTQIYAEADAELARRIADRLG